MRILFINTADSGGGAAIAASRLDRGLENFYRTENYWIVGQKNRDDPHIFSTRGHRSQAVMETKAYIELIFNKTFNRLGLLYQFFPFSSGYILRKARSLQPDLISLHNTHGGYFKTALLTRLSQIAPVVWTLHDMWSFTANAAHTFDGISWKEMKGSKEEMRIYPRIGINSGRWLLKQKRRIYRNSNIRIIAPSLWLYRLALESPVFQGKQITQIYHGVDLDLFRERDRTGCRQALGIPEDAHVLMFSCAGDFTQSYWKGGRLLEDILDSVHSKTEKKIDIILLGRGRIGKGRSWNNLSIHHMGYVDGENMMPTVYSASDVLIHASRVDNLALTLIEALACGTPSVSFDVGGNNEIIEDGKNGYLIKAFDIEDFANKTLSLLFDRERLLNFSTAARKRAENRFSLTAMAKAYHSLFESIPKTEGGN